MNILKRVGLLILFMSVCFTTFCQLLARNRSSNGIGRELWGIKNHYGSYTSNSDKYNQSSSRPFTVNNSNFTFTRDVCDPLALTCEAEATGFTSIKWDFGDGNVLSGVINPTHHYGAFGNYYVSLFLAFPGYNDTVIKRISIDVLLDQNLLTTPDTIICAGTGMQLRTIPGLAFCWSPTLYLDDPESSSPTSSPTSDITYYFRADVKGANLITNGDFSQGNTGFNSSYNYSPASGVFEGTYNIGTSITGWQPSFNNCGDHNTGSGSMMMVNGSNLPSTSLWTTTVTVTPNTNYELSAWMQNLTSPSPASLIFYVNGEQIGRPLNAGTNVCEWKQFKGTWSSAATTTAVINIVNQTVIPEGNDFAIDDISFSALAIKQDSVHIIVEKPVVSTTNDTLICTNSSLQLNTSGGQTYSWTPATGLSNPNISNPIATPLSATKYIVTGISATGCSAKDSVILDFRTKPTITISKDTSICKNSSVQLMINGGNSYQWSPAATLNDPNSANPVATPTENTNYRVDFRDSYTCAFSDSVEVSIRPDPVFLASNSVFICPKGSVQLFASGGNTYTWLPAVGLSNSTIPNPVASPSVTTQYSVTITESVCNFSASLPVQVEVKPLPNIYATKTNDLDCTVDQSQLNATGGKQYKWTPASSLSNPNIASPVARPQQTTEYTVAGTDQFGCIGYDTVLVKVEAGNEGQFLMPNAFTPNNDGVNDCFGIRYWGVIQKLEFSIFNRWGQRIFFTTNPQQCWDGYSGGRMQDNGVYIYQIKASTICAESVIRKGSFTLIR